ncbi:MAG: formylglycine-generating enzyme family protein [Terriglobales bacterium]
MLVAAAGAEDPFGKGTNPNQRLKSLGLPVAELVALPRGSFRMGSDAGARSEQPEHRVTLSPFWISRTEVTVSQFAAFIADSGYKTRAERSGEDAGGWVFDAKREQMALKADASWRHPYLEQANDHPVVLVTWHDASAYAEWLARKSGLKVRLPTEAQWEYACRAGTQGDYAGDLDALAWHKENSSRRTHAVAGKQANAWGLFDMHGNVWEWTRDWYSDYLPDEQQDPPGPADQGRGKIARGGSFNFPATHARASHRQEGHGPEARAQDLGFRIVVEH